jgi:hypothetical protein
MNAALTSIFRAGCTSIGVIDIILLVSVISYKLLALCSSKVSSEVNSLPHLSHRYKVAEPEPEPELISYYVYTYTSFNKKYS